MDAGYSPDTGHGHSANGQNRPNQKNYTTYDETPSTSHDEQPMRPNRHRTVARQSDYVNSDEPGLKLFGGFIGPYNQRQQHAPNHLM